MTTHPAHPPGTRVHAGLSRGHSVFSTARRNVHPQADTIKAAIEQASGGRRIRRSESETAGSTKPPAVDSNNDCSGINGRGERIRTSGLLVLNQDISTTCEHRRMKIRDLRAGLVDPDGPQNGGFLAVGPGRTLLSTLVTHVLLPRTHAVARTFENLSKICCPDRFSKSPYRRTSPQRTGRTLTGAAFRMDRWGA